MKNTLFFIGLFLFALIPSKGLLWAEPATPEMATLLTQIDRAESNQNQILRELDDITKELEIVKIRASQKQWLKQP